MITPLGLELMEWKAWVNNNSKPFNLTVPPILQPIIFSQPFDAKSSTVSTIPTTVAPVFFAIKGISLT